MAHSPRNAAREMRDLEILALRAGLQSSQRGDTPLFGPALGEEFTHYEVERAFVLMLMYGANIPLSELKHYSIHSLRIFVACALLDRKVPRATILRLLRWRDEASLEIYARLNDSEWASHVTSIYTAHVDSTISARLAALGPIDFEDAALRLAGLPAEDSDIP
jgi:hypothetical protein